MAHEMLSPGPVLDAYFKSYFGTFVFGSLFLGAFLTAKITNVFVGRALEPAVGTLYGESGPARRRVRPQVSPTTTDKEAFLARNLFDAKIEEPPPEGSAEEEAARLAAEEAAATAIDTGACNPNRCQASSVPVQLLATMWTGNPQTSMAVFNHNDAGKTKVLNVKVGEGLPMNAQVTAVERMMVCVSRAGSCEYFSLTDQKAQPKPSAPIAAAPSPVKGNGEFGNGVRALGDGEYEIPRAEIDNVLSNLNQIARQARIVPSFKDGKSNGFKLFSIRPNSLYSKIGIQNGDIVQKINGYEMNSPDKALQIYSKLKDAQSITVDIVRRGKPVTMSYSIR